MNTFFLIFVGLPALEIFLMIKIGTKIGALNTIALIFLTAVIGIYYARLQGLQTLKSGLVNAYQNKIPISNTVSCWVLRRVVISFAFDLIVKIFNNKKTIKIFFNIFNIFFSQKITNFI